MYRNISRSRIIGGNAWNSREIHGPNCMPGNGIAPFAPAGGGRREVVGPGVAVKDGKGQEWVQATANFLRKSEKLQVPEWVLARQEFIPYYENWFCARAAPTAQPLSLVGSIGAHSVTGIYEDVREMASCSATAAEVLGARLRRVRRALERLRMVEKDHDGVADWHLRRENSGQDRRTGNSCQHEALEQMIVWVGFKVTLTFLSAVAKHHLESLIYTLINRVLIPYSKPLITLHYH